MLISIVAIVLLILMSAAFSGSETALTASSRPRMHILERKGQKRARIVNRLTDRHDELIGSILLGNNLVNILASVLATSILIDAFGEAGIAYATIVMTVVILIFAEVLPKTYAINNPDRMALAVAPMVRVLVVALSPMTQAVQIVVRAMLRFFGAAVDPQLGLSASIEELRGLIDLHGRDLTSQRLQQQRAMLRSILDLDDVTVGEIMVHRRNVTMIDADQPASAAVDDIVASPFTRIPIWQASPDNIVGVIHAKELLRAARQHRGDIASLNLVELTARPWFIPESTSLRDQLQAFLHRHEHFALVVDEYGTLMGIVTLEDILEEIVGEITDELDVPIPGVRPQPDGSLIVDGGVTLRDLNRRFDWHLPDGQAATLAGLVLHEAREIPESGQVFHFHGFRFEIIDRERNRIRALRLTPPPPPENRPV